MSERICRQGDGSVCEPLYDTCIHGCVTVSVWVSPCVCVCVWREGWREGLLLTPSCDSDSNTCWHPFFPLSLSPHPSIPGGLPELFWELKSVDSFTTIVSLTHSPSLTFLHCRSNVFTISRGWRKKKNEAGKAACIFICGVCGSAKRNRSEMFLHTFYITGGSAAQYAVLPHFWEAIPK